MARFQLVVVEGKDAGRVVPLDAPSVTLGRPGAGVEGAIEFEDPSVSRVHAVLNLVDDQYELSNRSFTNPARVDGEPATTRVRLREGARIQLGSLVCEIRSGEVAAPPLMGFLELMQGSRPGARFPVYWKRSLIGRSSACEVHLEETAVSRHHAVVDWYERTPVLMNMSANSTTVVNGQSIPNGASLGPRDWIVLGGEVTLQWIPVEILAEEEERRKAAAAAPPPAPEPAAARRRRQGIPLTLRIRDLCLEAPLAGRVAFFSDLSARVEKGESIVRAVGEAASAGLPRLAPYLAQAVESGRSLSEAMARFPGSFDLYEDSMVSAGEEAGTLEAQLAVLARSLEDALAVRRALALRLRGRLPLLLVAALLLLLPFARVHGAAAFGLALLQALVVAGALLALLTLTLRLMAHSLPARQHLEAFLDGLPNLGPALRFRAGARFLRALGPLLSAGLQVQRAAVLAARCTGSAVHGVRLLRAAEEIREGTPVRDALGSTGILPYDILAEVGQGEEEGDLPERLAAASEGLAERARAEMEAAVPTMALAVLVALALVLAAGVGATYVVSF